MDSLSSMRSEQSDHELQNSTPRERIERLEIPSPKTARSIIPSASHEEYDESDSIVVSTSREFPQQSPSRLDVNVLISNVSGIYRCHVEG